MMEHLEPLLQSQLGLLPQGIYVQGIFRSAFRFNFLWLFRYGVPYGPMREPSRLGPYWMFFFSLRWMA